VSNVVSPYYWWMNLRDCREPTISNSLPSASAQCQPREVISEKPLEVFFADSPNDEFLFRLSARTWEKQILVHSINYEQGVIEALFELSKRECIPKLIIIGFKNEQLIVSFIRSELKWTAPIVILNSDLTHHRIQMLRQYKSVFIREKFLDYLLFKEEVRQLETLVTELV
jgi:hypothetical protein